ncbi:MAG: hypothetical protein Q8N31_02485 [Reyranella sp.]|nr:hypothetical protein [Reyranella sp.]MDP3158856.1 hypothetical protein [Reyranella sp.]
MAPKQKSRRKPQESGATRARPGPRKQTRARAALPPPLTLQQELLLMARSGLRSARQAVMALVVLALLAGIALGVWSLRPTPTYSSADLTAGSPFDVTFRVENKNPWFALSNLRISCVLDHVRASGIPPTLIGANDVRFQAGNGSGLEPGESATFTCPFRTLIGHPINDDPAIAQRAEIYFRGEYEVPLLGSFRMSDNSVPFFLNTRVLPPRWTSKP